MKTLFKLVTFLALLPALLAQTYPNNLLGNAHVQATVRYLNIVSASVTANQDNYSPTGIGNALVLILSTDASRTITGIVPGTNPNGRILTIVNGGLNDIVLAHDTTSTAANRFMLGGSNRTVGPGLPIGLIYDSSISRWRLFSGSSFASVTPSALTKVDDTNVTLTLGGSPSTSLLASTSITAGWAGQLSVARGGTGAGTHTGILVGNGTSPMTSVTGTASQLLRRNAGNTAYEFFTLPAYLTANQTITLSGDVTGSGATAITATVANNAVTLAKMADVATGTVFYRKTASTGDPEVQTLSTLKTDLGLTGVNSGDQTITLTGDVTGSGTGSFSATLSNTGVSAGTYKSVTVDAKGRITTGTNPTTLAGYGIIDATPSSRTLSTTSPLAGGGDLSANRTISINTNGITNSLLAQMATNTIKGNNTGGMANASDLTATQVTAMLNAFVGDSGSGGTKGLVPAPAAGDASKFLSGDGTYKTLTGGGNVSTNVANVFTERQDIRKSSADNHFVVGADAGYAAHYWWFRGATLARYALFMTPDAESGGNVGSRLALSYFNDAGSYVGDLFYADRLGNFVFPEHSTQFRWNGNNTSANSAVSIVNDDSATNGNQKYSPALAFKGVGYNTGSGNAVQPVIFKLQVQVAQGSGASEDPNNPTGDLVALYSVDGGADTANGFRIKWDGKVQATNIRNGTGSPESVVTANVGTLYLRTDGGSGTTLYVKESGTGNTGWVAK